MAAINITLDTDTRQVSLMIDGVTIPEAEVSFDYFFIKDEDGKEEKITHFRYSTKQTNPEGLVVEQVFRLPPPEEKKSNMLLPNGLAAITPEEEFGEKVKAWFNKRRS